MNRTSERYKKELFFSGIKLCHLLATIGVFNFFWVLFRYGSLQGIEDVAFRYNYFVAAGYGACLLFFSRTYNVYLLGYTRIRMLALSQFLAQFFSAAIVYLAVSVAWNNWLSPFWFLPMHAVDAMLDAVWSYLGNKLYFRLNPPKKTLLIYRNENDRRMLVGMGGKPTERLYSITEELMYDGSFQELRPRLAGYDALFVAGVNSRCRNGILKYCKEQDIVGFFLPHIGDVIMKEARHLQSFDSPVLYISRSSLTPEYRIVKRLFDITVSLLGIIVTSPIMIVEALAIHLCDGGPALYRQVRLTRDGKRFSILKFRSMRVDAEGDGRARLSIGDEDDRITPVGRVIRKRRLDELPQLFNILAGDMSFVGPRPERPEIAEQYCETLPDFNLRLQVKAGLTGYAQVYGRYDTVPYEKLQFDLLYINNMSVLTDLELLFATVNTFFMTERAA